MRATARAVWDIGTSDVTVVAGDDTARAALQRWSLPDASVNTDMSTEPDQIRTQVAALLAELPDIAPESIGPGHLDDIDIDDVARRLEQAHDVLVQALESVEKD